MSAMLDRPVTITAAEPDSGRIICVKAGRGRARWRPRTAVVFAGAAGDACQAWADRCCGTSTYLPVPGPHATGRAATLTSAGGCCARPGRWGTVSPNSQSLMTRPAGGPRWPPRAGRWPAPSWLPQGQDGQPVAAQHCPPACTARFGM